MISPWWLTASPILLKISFKFSIRVDTYLKDSLRSLFVRLSSLNNDYWVRYKGLWLAGWRRWKQFFIWRFDHWCLRFVVWLRRLYWFIWRVTVWNVWLDFFRVGVGVGCLWRRGSGWPRDRFSQFSGWESSYSACDFDLAFELLEIEYGGVELILV